MSRSLAIFARDCRAEESILKLFASEPRDQFADRLSEQYGSRAAIRESGVWCVLGECPRQKFSDYRNARADPRSTFDFFPLIWPRRDEDSRTAHARRRKGRLKRAHTGKSETGPVELSAVFGRLFWTRSSKCRTNCRRFWAMSWSYAAAAAEAAAAVLAIGPHPAEARPRKSAQWRGWR